jgi:hypothetical protein
MQSTRFSCHILTKFEFWWQIIGKYSDIKFHENPFSGSQADGQTDRRNEAKCLFEILRTCLKSSMEIADFVKSVRQTSCQKKVCSMRKAGDELAFSKYQRPILVTARSEAWVSGYLLTGIASSKPPGGMD